MLSLSLQTVSRAKDPIARLWTAAILYLLWRTAYGYFLGQNSGLGFRLLSPPFIFALAATAVADSLSLARLGRRPPAMPLVAGILLIIGGIGLDSVATVLLTPDFQLEDHPVIVTLRLAHYPDWMLYTVWAAAQSLFTVLACALWTAFLRHIPAYLNLIWAMDPHGWLQFLLTGLGVNPRRPFIRQRPRSYPRLYRFFWICALALIVPVSHWLRGFEWLMVRKILNGQPLAAWEEELIGFAHRFFYAGGDILFVGLAFLIWLSLAYFSRRRWRA